MKQEAVHFGENSIIKSVFHETKKPVNFNEESHYPIKNHTVKIHLNTLLDIDMNVMLFHLHYA